MAIVLGEEGYGETTVQAIKLGSSTVSKIYLGSNTVYTASGGGGGGGSSDSLWSSVRLLVPFESTANSVTHSNGQSITPTASGTSGSPSSALSSDYKYGTGGWTHYQGTLTYATGAYNSSSWTVEFWFKRNTNYSFTSNKRALVFGDFEFKHASSNNFVLYHSDDEEQIGSFGTAALDTYEHYAIVYESSTTRLYKGGTQITSSSGVQSAPSSFVVGAGGSLYNFSVDEIRVTDAARYPSGTTFTPPSSAHPTS
ncbi:MAG: hypothetical protein ISR34_09395 [Pirellulales bacterium]|nr:hypothetical protein [Pirellulales bacterium]